MKKNIRIGALISGGGTNLQAIINCAAIGQINGEIVFVGSDVPRAKGLERAKKAGVDTFVVDYGAIIRECGKSEKTFKEPADFDLSEIRVKQNLIADSEPEGKIDFFLRSRAVAERALLDRIVPYGIDLLVLAGFMRVMTPYLIDRINGPAGKRKIMNIHPALLPAFPGTDGYGDTFRYGCKVAGCTVHFIDYGEDTGPIIGQRAFQIDEGDTLETVKEKGLALEWELYPECIQKFALGLLP